MWKSKHPLEGNGKKSTFDKDFEFDCNYLINASHKTLGGYSWSDRSKMCPYFPHIFLEKLPSTFGDWHNDSCNATTVWGRPSSTCSFADFLRNRDGSTPRGRNFTQNLPQYTPPSKRSSFASDVRLNPPDCRPHTV